MTAQEKKEFKAILKYNRVNLELLGELDFYIGEPDSYPTDFHESLSYEINATREGGDLVLWLVKNFWHYEHTDDSEECKGYDSETGTYTGYDAETDSYCDFCRLTPYDDLILASIRIPLQGLTMRGFYKKVYKGIDNA